MEFTCNLAVACDLSVYFDRLLACDYSDEQTAMYVDIVILMMEDKVAVDIRLLARMRAVLLKVGVTESEVTALETVSELLPPGPAL